MGRFGLGEGGAWRVSQSPDNLIIRVQLAREGAVAHDSPPTPSTQMSANYLNREASWLEFNQRVLDEGRDASNPLLERLRFLAITASNLDEFFMVRVGGLRILVDERDTRPDPAGLSPSQQLQMVDARVRRMIDEQYACFHDVDRELAEAGLRRLKPEALDERLLGQLREVMREHWTSVLSPAAIDPEQPFPLLVNQAMYVVLRLAGDAQDAPRFVLIALRGAKHRFVTLPDQSGHSIVLMEDALRSLPDLFFPPGAVLETAAFRITRNADLSLQDDLAADLVSDMKQILTARRRSDCVRLELEAGASDEVRDFLLQKLDADESVVYRAPGPLDLAAFSRVANTPGFDNLRNDPWPPQPAPEVDPTVSMFETIAQGDLLLHHPYQTFDPIVRLIEEAADDPNVLAIKQTLYRTSGSSPIVAALCRAAMNGKFVTVILELKARFDEARNIAWARNMEESSVQVVYGVKGLKTHAKACMIVRREPLGVQRYLHFGTGNYNEQTARLYGDVSLLTCDPELGADASRFFNAVTGNSLPQTFHKIAAAPIGLREQLLEMIHAERQRKQQGQRAQIVAKMNSLSDPGVIDALYSASQAGVPIKLNVRGICCLKPGVPGLSENISVISIVDRFLEHSRILYFHCGGDERVFISSADWMSRNLTRRVELLTPVEDLGCKRQLIAILDAYFRDNQKARSLQPDGSYRAVEPSPRAAAIRCQAELYRQAVERAEAAGDRRASVFQPHRPAE